MPESAHPNRWFGANPQATAPQGKNLHGWTRDTPATWRSALGLGNAHEDREPPEGGGHWYPEPPKRRGPILIGLLVLAVVGIGIGWLIGNSTSSSSSSGANLTAKVDPTTAQGGHNFVNFACAACHGMQGKGGPDPTVPVLTTVGSTLSQAQIESIIADGIPGQVVKGSSGTSAPYMPTWRNILSKQQISDLAKYIGAGLPAVPNATDQGVPTNQGDVVAGSVLFSNYGCENCHGANGLGGVVNPSPDGTIPPLGGAAFDAQFPTTQSVTDVITSGSVIGKNPITSMPHWGGIIPQAQMNQMVAYIRTLPGPSGG
jgi:mono/diheme cytochrome c family protein